MKASYIFLPLSVVALFVFGCDIAKPQKSFRLAVPEKDYFYNRMASHLEPFLEKYGYEIEIVKATTSIDANKMVSVGEADLAFINNHSYSISQAADVQVGRLRTITPLATRIFLAFSKNPLPDTATAKELFENKRVGIELLNGEAHANIQRLFSRAKINGTKIVQFEDNADVIVF